MPHEVPSAIQHIHFMLYGVVASLSVLVREALTFNQYLGMNVASKAQHVVASLTCAMKLKLSPKEEK